MPEPVPSAPSPRRALLRRIALGAVLLKIAWVILLYNQGDYDYRRAHTEELARVVGSLASVPLHVILLVLLFFWDWARYPLFLLALASAAGVSGAGLFFGLPHYLSGNYGRYDDTVPWVIANIVFNLALAVLLLVPGWKPKTQSPNTVR